MKASVRDFRLSRLDSATPSTRRVQMGKRSAGNKGKELESTLGEFRTRFRGATSINFQRFLSRRRPAVDPLVDQLLPNDEVVEHADRLLPVVEVVKVNPASLVELKTALDDTVKEVSDKVCSHCCFKALCQLGITRRSSFRCPGTISKFRIDTKMSGSRSAGPRS